MYNTTNISAANNFVEQMVAVNQLSNQLFAIMTLVVLFIIIFIVFSQYDKKVLLMADSLAVSFIGILFFTLNMVGWYVIVVPLIIFFGSLIYLKING